MKSNFRRLSLSLSQGFASGAVIALTCAIGPGAHAQTLGPLARITSGDTFSGCTADQVHAQQAAFGSILFPATSIEPWVAVDPTNPYRLLVGHQQDRWNDGGSRGLVGVVSSDGGRTWANTIPSGVTDCSGGKYRRASDPWVDFSPGGTAFFFSLVLDPMKPTTPFGARNSAMLVSRSVDHGATWQAPVTLIRNNSPHVLNDKNSLTADPTANGNVYAVWDQLSVFPATKDAAQLLAENDGVQIARKLRRSAVTAASAAGGVSAFNYTGPTFFSRSTDDGVTWSTATPIYQPGTNKQTINNIVRVLPNGTLLDFFTGLGVTPAGASIGYLKSTNKGASWSAPTFPIDIQSNGAVTPNSGQAVRDASILFSVAVDPMSGALYLVWQDTRFSTAKCSTPNGPFDIEEILFSQSNDNGATWSTPVKINKTPVNATKPCRQQAFIPAVAVAGNGTVVVTYYDFRYDTDSSDFEGTDYFALFCTRECTDPGKWGYEKRLTEASFNMLDAPNAGGHFLGDYMGLAATGPRTRTVHPVFGIATAPNVTAEFTRKITLP